MKTLRWTTVALLTAVSLTATAAPGWAEGSSRRTSASETSTIIVTLEPGTPDPTRAAAAAVAAGQATVTRSASIGPNTVAVTMKNSGGNARAASVSAQAKSRAHIVTAEVSRRVYATTTNDTYYSSLWNINNGASSSYGVRAEDAWPTSQGAGSVIGVIDTGITNHSDLNDNVITGYDFISDSDNGGDGDGWDPDPSDEGDWDDTSSSSWHGTHVAGIAAAVANNSKGVAGVAPAAAIEPIRVLGWKGGYDSDIIAGIYWGAGIEVSGVPTNSHPADVLNLSLGGSGSCGPAMQNAINAAVSRGTAVVVAAGNGDASGNPLPIDNAFPANCSNVIRVTATDSAGAKATWSNYGTASYPATVAAPGVGIYSTVNSGLNTPVAESYAYMSGTSMAAPHVAGILAILHAKDSTLTVSERTALLRSSTTPLSHACTVAACGSGIAQAAKAVASPSLGSTYIAGTARVGRTMTANATFSPGASYLHFQWTRDGVAIGGATARTYTLQAADFNHRIAAKVTARIGTFSAVSGPSTAVLVNYGTFSKLKSPQVRGTMRVGRKLTAYRGAWSPSPTAYRYQWLRNGHKIKAATKSTYRLTKKDRGAKISVRVTVKRSYYLSRVATSSSRRAR
ncbi:MAG: S8 family serine peptidase [Propionicimonas sp.]